jgi:hypothetical protein
MAATRLVVVDQVLNGAPIAVAVSQAAKVVSNAFQINAEDAMGFNCRINATAVTGTAAIVKLQHSLDNVAANFVDVDATNAKVTLNAVGLFPLILNGYGSTLSGKMPLNVWCRFVCVTTGSDTCTISNILVQVRV